MINDTIALEALIAQGARRDTERAKQELADELAHQYNLRYNALELAVRFSAGLPTNTDNIINNAKRFATYLNG